MTYRDAEGFTIPERWFLLWVQIIALVPVMFMAHGVIKYCVEKGVIG